MSEFVIEVLINGENSFVQVKSPRGDNYLEMISSFQKYDETNPTLYKNMILYCTDIREKDYQKMGPRAITKTLYASKYAIEDKVPEDGELIPENSKFGSWSNML